MATTVISDIPVCVGKSYRFLEAVNSGNFWVVYSCEHILSGDAFACKVVRKGEFEDLSNLRREVLIMQKLAGQANIVQIHEMLEDEEHMYIIMELCDGGDLFDKLQTDGRFPEDLAKSVFRQIVNAVEFCHKRGIVHRDIKPENILLKSSRGSRSFESPGNEWQLKLADFGCSVNCATGQNLNGFYGSHHYMAPEIVTGEGHTEKADIWSLGVVLFALLSGGIPFLGYKHEEAEEDEDVLFEAIVDGAYDIQNGIWKCISPCAKDLVTMMLAVDQDQRPSANEILSHPWFQISSNFDVAGFSSYDSDLSRENSLSRTKSISFASSKCSEQG